MLTLAVPRSTSGSAFHAILEVQMVTAIATPIAHIRYVSFHRDCMNRSVRQYAHTDARAICVKQRIDSRTTALATTRLTDSVTGTGT